MARRRFQRGDRAHLFLAAIGILGGVAVRGQEPAAPSTEPPKPAARSTQPVNRPFAARRVVFQFDFEPDPREVFSLPQYWDLAQDGSRATGPRPGFPAWNTAAFD